MASLARNIFTPNHKTASCSPEAKIMVMKSQNHRIKQKLIQEIHELESLKDNWDGLGAERIPRNALDYALKVFSELRPIHLSKIEPEDDIIPYENGTLGLNFKNKSNKISIVIGENYKTIVLKNNELYTPLDLTHLKNIPSLNRILDCTLS